MAGRALRARPNSASKAGQSTLAAALTLMAMVLLAAPAWTEEWLVASDSGPLGLREVIAGAATGDRIVIQGGVHKGPLLLDKRLELVGRDWPVIEGEGRGTVIAISAPGVAISGFVIRGSGSSLDEENSGLTVDGGPGARIVDNRFEDVLFGIYLRKSSASVVSGNEIRGKDLDIPRRGDAIRVWYSNEVRIEDNRVHNSRDVVLWYSEKLAVRGNSVRGGRYGLHFMYCDDAAIEKNLLESNSVGAFLMYSRRLRLTHNTIVGNHGPSGFGVGLKDMDDAVVRENRFVGNRVGVFLDNSPRETGSAIEVRGNLIAGNDVGVSFLPNVRRGSFEGNSFVENQQQVEIAGHGADPEQNLWDGNFWSDYSGYDGDGDGVGDSEFRADRLFEDLSDRQPSLKLFHYSPAKDALELAARTMPLIKPRPKVIDRHPRMRAAEPEGCPERPEGGGVAFGPLGGGLVALASLILLVPGTLGQGAARGAGGVNPRARGEDSRRADREKLIRVRGVSKAFGGHRVLEGVSFDMEEGEAVAVWGPNGAGKTTLLRVLLGVIPYSGEVLIEGRNPWHDGRQVRAMIGFVPQEVSLQREMRVVETLAFFAALRCVSEERIPELLIELGLEEEADKQVGELSGGQRQRLALALALLSDPPLLILDEPTANLDARARADFIELLCGLKDSGRTLVFSSHRPEEVRVIADRVLQLDRGRLTGDKPPPQASLEGDRMAELWLRLPAGQVGEAESVLDSAGFSSRRLGAHLVVEVGANRKLEPIRKLLAKGVTLESFEVDTADVSGDSGAP